MTAVTNDKSFTLTKNTAAGAFPLFLQETKEKREKETRFGLKRQDIRNIIGEITGKWGYESINRWQVEALAKVLSEKTGYASAEFLPDESLYTRSQSQNVVAGSGPEATGGTGTNKILYGKLDIDMIAIESHIDGLFTKFSSEQAIKKMKKRAEAAPYPVTEAAMTRDH